MLLAFVSGFTWHRLKDISIRLPALVPSLSRCSWEASVLSQKMTSTKMATLESPCTEVFAWARLDAQHVSVWWRNKAWVALVLR